MSAPLKFAFLRSEFERSEYRRSAPLKVAFLRSDLDKYEYSKNRKGFGQCPSDEI